MNRLLKLDTTLIHLKASPSNKIGVIKSKIITYQFFLDWDEGARAVTWYRSTWKSCLCVFIFHVIFLLLPPYCFESKQQHSLSLSLTSCDFVLYKFSCSSVILDSRIGLKRTSTVWIFAMTLKTNICFKDLEGRSLNGSDTVQIQFGACQKQKSQTIEVLLTYYY